MQTPFRAATHARYPQKEVETALEALSTLTEISVACDYGVLCNSTVASTCSVEFLTELGDVPLISVTKTNVNSVIVTEYQVIRVRLSFCFHAAATISTCSLDCLSVN